MLCSNSASRCRTAIDGLVAATRSRIQTLESRVKSRLGSGSMTKSWSSINR